MTTKVPNSMLDTPPASQASLDALDTRVDALELSSVSRYEHTQSVAATTWTIAHNLGRHVITRLFDSAGKEFIGEVQNTSLNQTVVTLDTATAGYSVSI